MVPTHHPASTKSRRAWWLGAAACAALAVLLWGLWVSPEPEEHATTGASGAEIAAGPPWRYGSAQSRFTVIIYADLECPFCQSYTPVLRAWIDTHPDVNLQWHHLPLAMHEPAATEEARWVECVGEISGHARFWEAVGWVYQHTRGGGQGLPPGTAYPDDGAVQACLNSERPALAVRNQADQARKDGLEATPSLRLVDRESDRSMTLTGPVMGDALLSALDLLVSQEQEASQTAAQP